MNRLLGLALCVALGCVKTPIEQRHHVELEFVRMAPVLDGFSCTDDANVRLICRALPQGMCAPMLLADAKFNLVIDFLSTVDGSPIAGAPRVCLPLTIPKFLFQTMNQRINVGDLLDASLVDAGVSNAAPDGELVVRAISTLTPCDAIAAGGAIAKTDLIGCAKSQPVKLASQDIVEMQLTGATQGNLQHYCSGLVAQCAGVK